MPQAMSSDFAVQAILALLPDFLAQRQREIVESREKHIRVKSGGEAHQIINCRMATLEALRRDASPLQAASADDEK